MDNGFIKLHRKFLDWEWYHNSNTLRVFLHCLLKANYTEKKWQGILIKRGSFITSRDKLATELKLTVQKIRTSLNHLEHTQEITIKTTNNNHVISICNYDIYQVNKITNNQQDNQQITNEQPIDNQRITTTKNNKNNKNNKNEYMSETQIDKIYSAYPRKEGKSKGYEKLKKEKAESFDMIFNKCKEYTESRKGKDQTYTKQFSTWVNQKCWFDEIIENNFNPEPKKKEKLNYA